jgi:hypothetical protein
MALPPVLPVSRLIPKVKEQARPALSAALGICTFQATQVSGPVFDFFAAPGTGYKNTDWVSGRKNGTGSDTKAPILIGSAIPKLPGFAVSGSLCWDCVMTCSWNEILSHSSRTKRVHEFLVVNLVRFLHPVFSEHPAPV